MEGSLRIGVPCWLLYVGQSLYVVCRYGLTEDSEDSRESELFDTESDPPAGASRQCCQCTQSLQAVTAGLITVVCRYGLTEDLEDSDESELSDMESDLPAGKRQAHPRLPALTESPGSDEAMAEGAQACTAA